MAYFVSEKVRSSPLITYTNVFCPKRIFNGTIVRYFNPFLVILYSQKFIYTHNALMNGARACTVCRIPCIYINIFLTIWKMGNWLTHTHFVFIIHIHTKKTQRQRSRTKVVKKDIFWTTNFRSEYFSMNHTLTRNTGTRSTRILCARNFSWVPNLKIDRSVGQHQWSIRLTMFGYAWRTAIDFFFFNESVGIIL